ncbi:uncharacterized protein LOC132797545 isoform X2 [Drosophila nasuta]|uniref:uncharacterized protein LOC132797545 isoform X2 n=1 Tax=Drosophila nasuta TaxID=42062 RepID=UPI00295F3454|nr:uncharacterized protein LOC132797545 isoform X2 [Drosophila nasuta]
MVSIVRNLLCLVILSFLVSTGYAILCYQCNSMFNKDCGPNFEANGIDLIDCSHVTPSHQVGEYFPWQYATGCMKKTLKVIYFEDTGHHHFIRSCYFGNVDNKIGCQTNKNSFALEELACDVCTEDGCNGSASLTPIASGIILFVGVSRLLA